MTQISKSLELLLKDIYADEKVSLTEFIALRDESDQRWEKVTEEFADSSTLTSFQSTMDVAMHLLYLSIQHIKNEQISDVGEAIVKDAVMAQINYLTAGAHLTLGALKVGNNLR